MSDGLFGGLFDFNRDGEHNSWERTEEFCFAHEMDKEYGDDGFGFEESDKDDENEW